MTYSASNPPSLEGQTPAGSGKTWNYRSTDPVGTVDAAGYITNGQDLGMTVGDLVKVYNTTSSLNKLTMCFVDAVSSTGVTLVIESS